VQIPLNVEDIDLHIFLDKVEYKKFPLKLPFANIELTLFSETNILSTS
jgi:hypothetical protein